MSFIMCQNLVSENVRPAQMFEVWKKVKLSYGITLVEMQEKNRPLNVQQVQVSYLIMLLRAAVICLFDKITYKDENHCSEPCGFYSTERQRSKRLRQCISLSLTITTLSLTYT